MRTQNKNLNSKAKVLKLGQRKNYDQLAKEESQMKLYSVDFAVQRSKE